MVLQDLTEQLKNYPMRFDVNIWVSLNCLSIIHSSMESRIIYKLSVCTLLFFHKSSFLSTYMKIPYVMLYSRTRGINPRFGMNFYFVSEGSVLHSHSVMLKLIIYTNLGFIYLTSCLMSSQTSFVTNIFHPENIALDFVLGMFISISLKFKSLM